MLRHHHCHLLCHCAHGEAILRSCCLTSRQIRSWFSIGPFLSSAKLRNLRMPRQQMSQFFCEGFQAHNLGKSSFGICEGFCEGYEFHCNIQV